MMKLKAQLDYKEPLMMPRIVEYGIEGGVPGNVFLLRNQMTLSSDWVEVSQEKLLSLVAERLIDANSNVNNKDAGYVENQQQNIGDAIDLLPRLTTAINVNLKFMRIDDFKFSRECATFDQLDISLCHGWIVDPHRAHMFFEVVHICSNDIDESTYVLGMAFICFKEFDEKNEACIYVNFLGVLACDPQDVVGCEDGRARVFNMYGKKWSRIIKMHEGPVTHLSFSDDQLLIGGSSYGRISLSDLSSDQQVAAL
ncbi:ubiquitin carboxyl-terminal hydrolase MINDY-1 isoform X2 [Tanacetum coccineum]